MTMTIATLLGFSLAFFLLAISPGPGVATVVARALQGGVLSGLAAAAGLMVGDFLFIALAFAGLSALAATMGPLFHMLQYIGAAYLFWLGYRALTAVVRPLALDAPTSSQANLCSDAGAGLLVTLGNPKPILFYGALLPTFVNLATATWLDGVALAASVLAISVLVLGTYAALAARARSMFTTEKAMRRFNQASGAVMIGAGIAVAVR